MASKAKGTIYLNFKNKSEEKKQKIYAWLQCQENQTNSILSLIEHAIDRFGYKDIMDHSISKKLYTEMLVFNEDGNAFSLNLINNDILKNREIDLENTQEDYYRQTSNLKSAVEEDKHLSEKMTKEKSILTEIDVDNF